MPRRTHRRVITVTLSLAGLAVTGLLGITGTATAGPALPTPAGPSAAGPALPTPAGPSAAGPALPTPAAPKAALPAPAPPKDALPVTKAVPLVETAPATVLLTATTIAPLGGQLPPPPSTLPLATKQQSAHLSGAFAILSAVGFGLAAIMLATQYFLSRPGRRRHWTL